MKWLKFLGLSLVIFILQVGILDNLRFFFAKPDLILVMVIFAALYFKGLRVILFALIFGLLSDSASFTNFGVNTLIFCSIVVSVRILRYRTHFARELDPVIVSIYCVAASSVMKYVFTAVGFSFPSFLKVFIFSCAYTLACAFCLFKLLRKFKPDYA